MRSKASRNASGPAVTIPVKGWFRLVDEADSVVVQLNPGCRDQLRNQISHAAARRPAGSGKDLASALAPGSRR